MMRGLLIHVEYIEKMLNGGKKYEYRDRKCGFLGQKIRLLAGGYSYGWVVFSKNKRVESGWAWKISAYKRYKSPKKYRHPNGAQYWVRNVKGYKE